MILSLFLLAVWLFFLWLFSKANRYDVALVTGFLMAISFLAFFLATYHWLVPTGKLIP